jgi:hypothetical protein
MAITFADRKIRDANRKATTKKHGGGKVKNDPSAISTSADMLGRDPSNGDAIEIALDEIASWFPEEDDTAQVFRGLVIDGKTQEQLAVALGCTVRTIHNKKKTILCHIMDRFLDSADMPSDERVAIRLVLDPRHRVRADSQLEGARISELDRRISAAARSLGIEPATMRSRVLQSLSRLIQELQQDAAS